MCWAGAHPASSRGGGGILGKGFTAEFIYVNMRVKMSGKWQSAKAD